MPELFTYRLIYPALCAAGYLDVGSLKAGEVLGYDYVHSRVAADLFDLTRR
jgi:hypothetical protein